MHASLSAVVLVCCTTACGTAIAPLPYTAEQIRTACPPGQTRIFRVEQAGKPVKRQTLRFVSATADEAEVEITMSDESGKVLEAPQRSRARWEELRQHAAFPLERTSIADDTVTTPAGTFAVKLYTVKGDGDEIKRFAFSKTLAGPPVVYSTDKGGARISTSTLIAVEPSKR